MKTEETKMVNYLNRTSKHLFQRNGHIAFKPNAYKHQEYMLKIFTISINKLDYRVKVEFNDEVTNIYINKILAYDKNSFNIMKTSLFPNGETDTIKTFKKVRNIMNSIRYEYNSIEEAKLEIKTIFDNSK